jgi:Potential Queuosine, Q, salvage protein family
MSSVPEEVREACAWVAARARSVSIDGEAVERYGATVPDTAAPPAPDPATQILDGDVETQTAFTICLDAINFGSGWWPTIRKRPGQSGYFTIAGGVTERFRERGPWSARELTCLSAAGVAAVVGQDPDHPLMADYAASLRDVGERVLSDHGGRFAAVVEAAEGSAPALAGLLAGWDAFADVSTYGGRRVPFFKRAQLVPADLERTGVVELRDRRLLTAFADNLVPHVLRVDSVLRLDPQLERKIEAGELLEHGSPEEVELRAGAVHAVELLAGATGLAPADVDLLLWARGQGPRYKAVPRPRSRNTAY